MKSKITKNAINTHPLRQLLVAIAFVTTFPSPITTKSLYIIADIKGASTDMIQPVIAYDIGTDGVMTRKKRSENGMPPLWRCVNH